MIATLFDLSVLEASLGQQLSWLGVGWALLFLVDFVRYAVPAGLAVLMLWVVFGRRLAHRRIQGRFPAHKHVRREFLWSLSSLAIFAASGIFGAVATIAGWTQIYLKVGDYGWLYWAASLIALILLHDAWFYWTHRAMHHRKLFRVFHRVHHKSHNPSPWAAYAFAPAEAVVQTLFLTLLIFVMPLHPSAIGLFVLHQIIRNVLGHSGIELFPKGTASHPVGKFITTHTHHDLHHSRVTGNYGLYFTWWDRWMGTLRDDYEATFNEVTTRSARQSPEHLPEHRPDGGQAGSTSTVATATPAP